MVSRSLGWCRSRPNRLPSSGVSQARFGCMAISRPQACGGMLNLDTHILIHAFQGSLTGKERKILSSDAWSISGIVLWEISKLVQLGRVEMDLSDPEVIRALSKVHT